MSVHLILGGARSGKSRLAERLAADSGLAVSVIVTAEALDAEMAERIARHRADRPTHWRTVERPRHLAQALQCEAAPARCVIVDCLSLWLTNLLTASPTNTDDQPLVEQPPRAPQALEDERAELLAVLPRLPGEILLVSNEVGLGLVPETPLGRLFRDEAGRCNQAVAAVADAVSFVAAGLPLRLK